jgi:uncharacterized protein (TIGR02611 family)
MSGGPTLVERLRAQRARHLRRSRVVRVLVVIAGFTVLLAGVLMLVLPGPAFAVIPIGLALLSLEFAWAGRLLEKALVQAEKARESARRTSRAERVAVGLAAVLAIAAAVVASVLWEIPVVPFT